MWWWVPVVPFTQEAETENCLNLGGGGCSELRLHHGTPAWGARTKLCEREGRKEGRKEGGREEGENICEKFKAGILK